MRRPYAIVSEARRERVRDFDVVRLFLLLKSLGRTGGYKDRSATPDGWIPGNGLATGIIVLLYAFFVLGLVVNYASGVAFFLLAIAGMYVGFRRGFVRGLTRAEKTLMAVFAVYPAVAIVSYLLGIQTNVGFRYLGRDMRFLLFIPIYLSVRWAHVGIPRVRLAMAIGCLLAAAVGVYQAFQRSATYLPHGAMSVSIVYGNVVEVLAFSGATLYFSSISGKSHARWIWAGILVLVAGMVAAIASGSRGAWLAVPFLVLILWVSGYRPVTWRTLLLALGVVTLAAGGAALSSWPRQRVVAAFSNFGESLRALSTRPGPAADAQRICPNSTRTLSRVRDSVSIWPPGHPFSLSIESDDAAVRDVSASQIACPSGNVLVFHNGSRSTIQRVVLPIAARVGDIRHIGILAVGRGRLGQVWTHNEVSFDNSEMKPVILRVAHMRSANLVVSVAPGETVRFIPLQFSPGAIYFSWVRGTVSERLVLWDLAIHAWLLHPVLGMGTGAFQRFLLREGSAGRAPPSEFLYEHAHSDILTAAAFSGVFGLLALALVYLGPLFVVRVGPWSAGAGDGRVKAARVATTIVVAGFFVGGLTETLFSHADAVSWYVVLVATLVALCRCEGPTGTRVQGGSQGRPDMAG